MTWTIFPRRPPALAAPLLAAAVLAGACAGTSPAARQTETLIARGDYGGAARAADEGLAKRPDDPLLWRLKMRAVLGTGDARAAVAAYETWRQRRGGSDDPEALSVLAKTTLWQGLHSPSPAIQAAAIEAIERLEIEELAPDVAQLIGSDHDVVAAAAASALLRAHPQAPRVLVNMLESRDPAARTIAVRGIGRKVGARAREDVDPLLRDPDAGVRGAAVTAVARYADAGERAQLVAIAQKDAAGSVRALALRGLSRHDPAALVDLARRAVTGDHYLGARLAAIDLLAAGARAGSAPARAALAELAAQPDLEVAIPAAAASLRSGGPAAAAEALFGRAMDDARWTARAAALNAASACPRVPALKLGGRGLADRRAEVRLAAARLLISLGPTREARAELERDLTASDALVRVDAATDLARLGDPRGLATLARLARSPSAEVRAAAVNAHRAAHRIGPGLVAGLADPRPETRILAAELIVALTK